MSTRTFALIAGIVYVLIGLLGFVPGLRHIPTVAAPGLAIESGYGYLLGLFPINVLHNFVHLGVGIWGLAASPSIPGSRNFARGLTIFYGLLTVLGLFPVTNTLFGLAPIFGHDIWLHALTAVIAAYFGWRAVVETAQYTRPSGGTTPDDWVTSGRR